MTPDTSIRRAVAIRHLAFEDMDALEPLLARHGFSIEYIDSPTHQGSLEPALNADLLVVLGGPIGVYQNSDFPFLDWETEIVRGRLAAGKPVLGICLGAQIMVAALRAKVYPGKAGKEIGWKPLSLTAAGQESPLAALGHGQPVLHWHGDTFDLPAEAELLAGTDAYPHQAFSIGSHGLALQFHIEATAEGLERWYVGHIGELSQEGLSIPGLRAAAARYAPGANGALEQVLANFLAGIAATVAEQPLSVG